MNFFIPDKASQFRFLHSFAKRIQFFSCSLSDQLNPSIRQVPYRSSHLIAVREHFGGVTEADSLHPARIKYLHPLASLQHRNIARRDEATTPLCHATVFRLLTNGYE